MSSLTKFVTTLYNYYFIVRPITDLTIQKENMKATRSRKLFTELILIDLFSVAMPVSIFKMVSRIHPALVLVSAHKIMANSVITLGTRDGVAVYFCTYRRNEIRSFILAKKHTS
jgi:hypothetical protein